MAPNTSAQDSNKGIWPDVAGEQDDDKLVPPYEGRAEAAGGSESSRELRDSVERQLAETHGPGTGATSSPASEEPVQPDQVQGGEPEDPYGVGESQSRRGEDVKKQEGTEPGRRDLGTKGQSDRPYGTTDARDLTGIDPQEPRD